jgi:polyphosphate kinase
MFDNAHRPEVYVGSADWMPRNLHRRIEVVFPIEDGRLRDRVMEEILETELVDNTKARVLRPDGSYWIPPRAKAAKVRRAQAEFIERVHARKAVPKARRLNGTDKLLPRPRPRMP